MGDASLEQDDLENALVFYGKAYKQDKKQVEGKLDETLRRLEGKSKELFDQGRFGESREILSKLQDSAPNYRYSKIQPDFVDQTINQHKRYRRFGRLVAAILATLVLWAVAEVSLTGGFDISWGDLIMVGYGGTFALIAAFFTVRPSSINVKFSSYEFFAVLFFAALACVFYTFITFLSLVVSFELLMNFFRTLDLHRQAVPILYYWLFPINYLVWVFLILIYSVAIPYVTTDMIKRLVDLTSKLIRKLFANA